MAGDARHLGCPSREAKVVLHDFRQLFREELSGRQESSFDDNERRVIIESFFEFVDTFVVCMYGKQRLNVLLKENREKSVIDLITPQDIAYTILMVENNYESWKFNIQKKADPAFDARSPPSSPYTLPKNVHMPAHHCNWTEPAQKYYETLSNIMFRLMNLNTLLWEEITDGWEAYYDRCGTSGASRYTKRQRIKNPNASCVSSATSREFCLTFALPSTGKYYNPLPVTNDGMDSRDDDDDDDLEEEVPSSTNGSDDRSENSDDDKDDVPTNQEIDGFLKPKLLELCSTYGVASDGTVPHLKAKLKRAFRLMRCDVSLGSIKGV